MNLFGLSTYEGFLEGIISSGFCEEVNWPRPEVRGAGLDLSGESSSATLIFRRSICFVLF